MKKSFRILLTESCNANCKGCFNASYRNQEHMDLLKYKKLCNYLSDNGVVKLKIMGGEPTCHPYFEEMIEYAQLKFKKVHIFTNAINDKIKNISIRDKDSIIYNFRLVPEKVNFEKLLLNKNGLRLLEIQISSDCDINEIEEKLLQIYNNKEINNNKVQINLTLNCMEDIFENRDILINKWNKLHDFITEELNEVYNIDHNIPYCFFLGSSMKIKPGKSICDVKCNGLIDSQLNLRYCNQYPDKIINIYQQGRFIPFEIIENYLYKTYIKKIDINMNKLCLNCVFFNRQCNGGCFMHKDIIKKESIIENIDLPII